MQKGVFVVGSHANRGRNLEELVNQANRWYERKRKAVITQIPTAWKIHRRYSPKTKKYEVSGAFPEKKSTVDYGGTAQNQAIWFDAKSTKNKTSFPLSNIHQHQIDYLQKVAEQGGKAFFLVHSENVKKTWILWIDQLLKFSSEFERKSIPFDWFEANCETVPRGKGIVLDYLPLALRRNDER